MEHLSTIVLMGLKGDKKSPLKTRSVKGISFLLIERKNYQNTLILKEFMTVQISAKAPVRYLSSAINLLC